MRLPWRNRRNRSSDSYGHVVDRCVSALQARRSAQAALLHLDKASWAVDRDQGTITFSRPEGIVARAPVQIIGSLDTVKGMWRWGWDNPSVTPPLVEHAQRVRSWGENHGVRELTTAMLEADDDTAWRFAALACELNEAQGAWRCDTGRTAVLVTFGTVTLGGADSAEGPRAGRPRGGGPRTAGPAAADDDWTAGLDDLPQVQAPKVLDLVRGWMSSLHVIELRYRDERIAAPDDGTADAAADRAIRAMQPVYERSWRRDDEYWRPCAAGMAHWYDVDAMSDWTVRFLGSGQWRVTYTDGEQAKAYDVHRFPDGLRIVDHLD